MKINEIIDPNKLTSYKKISTYIDTYLQIVSLHKTFNKSISQSVLDDIHTLITEAEKCMLFRILSDKETDLLNDKLKELIDSLT